MRILASQTTWNIYDQYNRFKALGAENLKITILSLADLQLNREQAFFCSFLHLESPRLWIKPGILLVKLGAYIRLGAGIRLGDNVIIGNKVVRLVYRCGYI